MIEGQTIDFKTVPDMTAIDRMVEIDEWAVEIGIYEYVTTGWTCVRISKDEYVTLFALKFADYIDYGLR